MPEAQMEPVSIELEKIDNDPDNARTHSEEQLKAIANSLEQKWGQYRPVILKPKDDGRYVCIAGNGLVMAAKDWTNRTMIDALVLDLTDDEAKALAVADNRLGDMSSFDYGKLNKIVESLKGTEFDDLLEDMDVQALSADGWGGQQDDQDDDQPEDKTGNTDNDEVPEIPEDGAETVTQRGDLWILGEHRLMCGDSLDKKDVAELMNGEKAALCNTDPPYLINYTGKRGNDQGKDWSEDYDEASMGDPEEFWTAAFERVLEHLDEGAAIYCWHATSRYAILESVWINLGILPHQTIIWVKPVATFSRSQYHWRHEPCLHGWPKGSMPKTDHDRSLISNTVWEEDWDTDWKGRGSEHKTNQDDDRMAFSTVWHIDWEGSKRVVGAEHPTQKPVEVFAIPMRKHTEQGELCYEPFSGSGSQLIAGEATRRRVYAMEISEKFCDVSVRRWEKWTGEKAVRYNRDGEELPGMTEQDT